MLFFYVRHGDPIYTPDSLTEIGHAQAKAISKRFERFGLDKIYSSSSNRAMQTATPTCEILNKDMTVLDFCNEGHAWRAFSTPEDDGSLKWAWKHKKYRELFVSEEIYKLGEKWYDHPSLSDRSWKDVVEKYREDIYGFFETLGYKHDEKNNVYTQIYENNERVALFAHQGFFAIFMSCLLDIPLPQFGTRFDSGHTGMTVIEMKESDGVVIPKVLQVSNDAHLYNDKTLRTYYDNYIEF